MQAAARVSFAQLASLQHPQVVWWMALVIDELTYSLAAFFEVACFALHISRHARGLEGVPAYSWPCLTHVYVPTGSSACQLCDPGTVSTDMGVQQTLMSAL